MRKIWDIVLCFGKAADVSPSTLHELMTGKTKPYLYTVYKICNALIISISDLLLEESRYLVW